MLTKLLKTISKKEDPVDIYYDIASLDMRETFSGCDFNTSIIIKLLLCILKALTDKGMKTHAHMLSQEYNSMEDLDGDKKIYGLDWVYENPPRVLEFIINKNCEQRKFEPIR